MKRIFLLFAAALSLAAPESAATRPRFGGTLRVEMRGAISSFDITEDANGTRALLRDVVLSNVCDRLVTLDANGDPEPSLATSWRSERDARSWYFTLQDGVRLHNGNTLTPQNVVTALSAQNPDWQARATGSELLIQSDTPMPDILYQLAEPHNSICLAGDNGEWIGSGPFQIGSFQPGQQLELRAFDGYWQGRSFLDRVRIQMGRSFADQAADLQTERADLVESDPTQPHPPGADLLSFTEPVELIALAFTPNHPANADAGLREALARALDRNSIYSVLLHRQGQPSAALLPAWISGYDHLFKGIQDLAQARRLRNPVGSLMPLTLAYDSSDDLARLVAERVALNAQAAGITLQPRAETPSFRGFNADVRLIRIRLESPEGGAALSRIGSALNSAKLQKAQTAGTAQALYAIEGDALSDYSIIPIAHLPEAYSRAATVHDWSMARWEELKLGKLWIEVAK
jgi:peptide/nickel transport system substrate-binding protein